MAASFKLLPAKRPPPKVPKPPASPAPTAPEKREVPKAVPTPGRSIVPKIPPAMGRILFSMLASGSPVLGLIGRPLVCPAALANVLR